MLAIPGSALMCPACSDVLHSVGKRALPGVCLLWEMLLTLLVSPAYAISLAC